MLRKCHGFNGCLRCSVEECFRLLRLGSSTFQVFPCRSRLPSYRSQLMLGLSRGPIHRYAANPGSIILVLEFQNHIVIYHLSGSCSYQFYPPAISFDHSHGVVAVGVPSIIMLTLLHEVGGLMTYEFLHDLVLGFLYRFDSLEGSLHVGIVILLGSLRTKPPSSLSPPHPLHLSSFSLRVLSLGLDGMSWWVRGFSIVARAGAELDLLLSVDFVRTPRTGSCGLHGNWSIRELICTYWPA
ncbi:hypothetical protein F2Q70_00015291 [Brassica cretica]|uniref:Uncharacterized protein n=1 Tax=Brassica cretica TaxID=69181 RepID=A0A8S9KRG6_BRACR|nr:hypothetical protein F2Q70_00015291 [Brassica cretica]KAF2597019.1 hypothetical protein F2Q68_00008345 [Brassica cretica]